MLREKGPKYEPRQSFFRRRRKAAPPASVETKRPASMNGSGVEAPEGEWDGADLCTTAFFFDFPMLLSSFGERALNVGPHVLRISDSLGMSTSCQVLPLLTTLGLIAFVSSHDSEPSVTLASQTIALEEALAEHISAALRRPEYLDVDVAIDISGVEALDPLFSRDAEKLYIPASAVKIFPSAISLIHLGAETRFVTPIETHGEVEDGVLRGDLFLIGKGDPSLTNADLAHAAREIRNIGIHRVAGDLVYDISFLDEERPCCPPNARHLYAPPGALTINNNSILLELDDGPPPQLSLNPQTSYGLLHYDIEVSTSDQPGRPKMTYREHPWGDEYTVQGTVTEWDKHFNYLRLGVSRPGLFAATLLQEALAGEGVEIVSYTPIPA
jgi:D-alanyl-D-alanine carboxypeptidase